MALTTFAFSLPKDYCIAAASRDNALQYIHSTAVVIQLIKASKQYEVYCTIQTEILEEENELTQGVGLAILVRNGEHAHHSVSLLPQTAVYLLAKQALANYC